MLLMANLDYIDIERSTDFRNVEFVNLIKIYYMTNKIKNNACVSKGFRQISSELDKTINNVIIEKKNIKEQQGRTK